MTQGLAPRRAACDAVISVLKDRWTLETALERSGDFSALEPRDRAFARLIAATRFRRAGQIEAVLANYLTKPLDAAPRSTQAILTTAIAQLVWLETPPHAVVATAVELAGQYSDSRKLKGLVNAVLRKAAPNAARDAARLPPVTNLPAWLRERWEKNYGVRTVNRIAVAQQASPLLDLTVKSDASIAHWADALGAARMPNGTLRLDKVGDVTALAGYQDGAWWAQDAAAALPARLLEAGAGRTVVDLCAAPGGKTLQLAASGARVIAVDNSASRMKRVEENLARTGLQAECIIADAREWEPDELVDAVLLDAPCSATGTLRRHPEGAWIKQAGDVIKLVKLQRQLASKASRMLKPGGQLIVCTCSLQAEEGEFLASDILRRNKSLKPDPIKPDELPGMEEGLSKHGHVRLTPALWPKQGGMDGFFIARFRKKDSAHPPA